MMPPRWSTMSMLLLLLVEQPGGILARNKSRRQRPAVDNEIDEGLPAHWSKGKKAEVQKATDAEAIARRDRSNKGLSPLPMFPTHTTVCDGRPCRPGEGNLKGYQVKPPQS